MPEHFHVLISEPEKGTPSTVMQVVKQRFAQRMLRARRRRQRGEQQTLGFDTALAHVWQARFYDFNVWSQHKRAEKLHYMHANPVKRGLVLEPGQWAWSSFRGYALDEPGGVKLNQWPAAQLKRIAWGVGRNFPALAQNARTGHPREKVWATRPLISSTFVTAQTQPVSDPRALSVATQSIVALTGAGGPPARLAAGILVW